MEGIYRDKFVYFTFVLELVWVIYDFYYLYFLDKYFEFLIVWL